MSKEYIIECFLNCKGEDNGFQLTLTNKAIDVIANEIERLNKKIERLNNIINELEKESYLGMMENQNNNDYAKGLYTAYKYIDDKLQELKESNK